MPHDVTRREQIDIALLRRYHHEDDAMAREELAERCLPLVRSLARKYANRGEDMDDLVQAGTVGLVKAIDRYDVDAGYRFVSFAVPNITGEIRRHFRDHTWAVHVPRSLQELDAKVQSTTRAMVADTGREPTDGDLAVKLDVPIAEIRDARSAGRSYRALSLDAPAGEGRDMLESHGGADPGYARVEDEATLEDAMTPLDDRERDVVTMRFGREMLQREIAERVGVSQMQVSRIISGAVAKMADHVDPERAHEGRGDDPAPLAA